MWVCVCVWGGGGLKAPQGGKEDRYLADSPQTDAQAVRRVAFGAIHHYVLQHLHSPRLPRLAHQGARLLVVCNTASSSSARRRRRYHTVIVITRSHRHHTQSSSSHSKRHHTVIVIRQSTSSHGRRHHH